MSATGPTARLYATNWGSHDVSVYSVEPDGSLRTAPALVPGPRGATNPLAAVLGARGRSLFVSNWGSGDLSRFERTRDGLVADRTVEPGAPQPVNPAGLAQTSDGRFLFMAGFNGGGSGTISTFVVRSDGTATAHGGTIDARGAGSSGVALSPDDKTLYVANMTSNDVSVFHVTSSGELGWLQSAPAGHGAFFPSTTADGRRLLVANALGDTVTAYGVDGTGHLTKTDEVPTGAPGPRGIVVRSDALRAYVAHYNAGTGPGLLATLAIDRDGRLNSVGEAVWTGGNGAEAMALNRSASCLYVANFNAGSRGNVAVFSAGPTGSPALVGAPIPTGGREPDFGGLVFAPTEGRLRSRVGCSG